MLIFHTAKSSSVDHGGGGEVGPPHWLQSMQKTLFLLLLETNFCSKSKNNPPTGIGNKNVTALTME